MGLRLRANDKCGTMKTELRHALKMSLKGLTDQSGEKVEWNGRRRVLMMETLKSEADLMLAQGPPRLELPVRRPRRKVR